jgi:hypothetical protein
MKKQIIIAAKNVGIISVICFVTSLFYWIFVTFNLGGLGYLLFYNPFLSALVHADLSHFAYNMLMLFLCLIPAINQDYKIKQLVYVATILSFLYFPLILFQFSLPIIGISMFAYFLLARIVFSREKYFWFFLSVFVITLIGEATLIQSDDNTAHLAHIFGATLGTISTRFSPKLFRPAKSIT